MKLQSQTQTKPLNSRRLALVILVANLALLALAQIRAVGGADARAADLGRAGRDQRQKGFQFRLEMFNVINHPDFGLPGATLGGPGFGVVSRARAGRNIQVGLRLVF